MLLLLQGRKRTEKAEEEEEEKWLGRTSEREEEVNAFERCESEKSSSENFFPCPSDIDLLTFALATRQSSAQLDQHGDQTFTKSRLSQHLTSLHFLKAFSNQKCPFKFGR